MFFQKAKKTDFFEVALFCLKIGLFITILINPKQFTVLKLALLWGIILVPIEI